eukprot:1162059-Prymnesium_polylepis.1
MAFVPLAVWSAVVGMVDVSARALTTRCQLKLEQCRGHDRSMYRSWFDVGAASECRQRLDTWKKICGTGSKVEARVHRTASSSKAEGRPHEEQQPVWPVDSATPLLSALRSGWHGNGREASTAAATLPQAGIHGWNVDMPVDAVPGSSRVLLLLCGLLRYYKEGIRRLDEALFDANRGMKFEVGLLTASQLLW